MFPRVGLVLGGGGAVGMAFHAGVLSAIAEATRWDPREAEVVVGTSAGAVSGAELRAGLSPDDLGARRSGGRLTPAGERLLRTLGPAPVPTLQTVSGHADASREAFARVAEQAMLRPGSVRLSVLISVALSPGPFSIDWLASTVRWLHGNAVWPAKALWLCAVRLDTGERVIFGRAGGTGGTGGTSDLGDAVAASCSMPGVWAPTRIDGISYIDGGAYSPTNVDVLAGIDLDLVIVSAPMCIAPSCPKDRCDRLARADCRHALEDEVRQLHARRVPVEIFEPGAEDLGVMGTLSGDDALDQKRCAAVTEQARRTTLRRLARAGLPGIPVHSAASLVNV